MRIPDGLKYTKDHEWVRLIDEVARVGITDHAQDALGDVVFVALPNVGDTVLTGQRFGEVESTKSVSEMYAPIGGTITAVNSSLESRPELINTDPYGEGWICEIDGFEASEVDALLDASRYRSLTDG